MIYLNAGNLWDNEYLDKVIEWNKEFEDTIQVKSLFGSMVGVTPTARSFDRLPARGWDFTREYVKRAQENGINIRYTLNQSCIGSMQDFKADWDGSLRRYIKEFHDLGIHEWTITSPLLMELIHKMFPGDLLEVSTIAEVSTPEDAIRWSKLGARGVNLSTSINRDFSAISKIVDTGVSVSILANEACLFGCPWRRECYNLSSHNSLRGEKFFDWYPFNRCNEVRLNNPVEWISARLLIPQWMTKYQDAVHVDWFKVAFRTHPKEVALPILRKYMEQDFHGNLLELWPTIAQLGHTDEPQQQTYISIDKLEENKVLEYFLNHGSECSKRACEDCRACYSIYQLVTDK